MFSEFIASRISALNQLSDYHHNIDAIGDILVGTLEVGGKVITCGNGGSEANHLTTELMGRFLQSRPSIPSVCLSANCDVLTCLGNDYGFENIFSRQLRGIGAANDIFIAFTTSGNSENVRLALEEAKEMGLWSVAVLGKDGGKCRGLANQEIILPSQETAIIQEMSLGLIHYWCGMIDKDVAK